MAQFSIESYFYWFLSMIIFSSTSKQEFSDLQYWHIKLTIRWLRRPSTVYGVND